MIGCLSSLEKTRATSATRRTYYREHRQGLFPSSIPRGSFSSEALCRLGSTIIARKWVSLRGPFSRRSSVPSSMGIWKRSFLGIPMMTRAYVSSSRPQFDNFRRFQLRSCCGSLTITCTSRQVYLMRKASWT